MIDWVKCEQDLPQVFEDLGGQHSSDRVLACVSPEIGHIFQATYYTFDDGTCGWFEDNGRDGLGIEEDVTHWAEINYPK